MTDKTCHVNDATTLVRLCLEGNERCQQELVDRYTGLCISIASRILGSYGESYVEDAVQEAFFAVFAKLDQWQGRNLSAWIGTVAARRSCDVRRRIRRTNREHADPNINELAAPPPKRDALHSPELRDAFESARRQMSVRQQRVLDALLAQKSRGQIAEELAISPRTVYYELAKIRDHLRRFLGPFAVSPAS